MANKNARRETRCIQTIEALRKLPRDFSVQEVLDIVKASGLTRFDFPYLDEKPGMWPFDHREWHWKLRVVRNSDSRLFEIMEQNEE